MGADGRNREASGRKHEIKSNQTDLLQSTFQTRMEGAFFLSESHGIMSAGEPEWAYSLSVKRLRDEITKE